MTRLYAAATLIILACIGTGTVIAFIILGLQGLIKVLRGWGRTLRDVGEHMDDLGPLMEGPVEVRIEVDDSGFQAGVRHLQDALNKFCPWCNPASRCTDPDKCNCGKKCTDVPSCRGQRAELLARESGQA